MYCVFVVFYTGIRIDVVLEGFDCLMMMLNIIHIAQLLTYCKIIFQTNSQFLRICIQKCDDMVAIEHLNFHLKILRKHY